MLKYILLLCLILQLGACKKIHVRQRSEDAAVKQVEPVVAKENVETKSNDEVTENTTHVVKKDHPEESNNEKEQVTEVTAEARNDVQVKSEVTAEETPVPVEVNEKRTNKNEEVTEETAGPKNAQVKSDVTTKETPVPVEVNEKEKYVKIDKEQSFQENGSSGSEAGENENVTGINQLKTLVENDEKSVQENDSIALKQGALGLGNICKVNNQIGTCVPSGFQCSSSRGTILGSLGANGQCPPLSVCCQVTRTCGQSSSKRSVVFANPTQFATTTTTCDFTVNVVDPKVCQIRLDFDAFIIANTRQSVANAPFNCIDDSFTVLSPSNEKIPTICGFNTGQHMYVRINVTNNERSIRLRFNLAGRPSTVNGVVLTNPLWKIRVTQLECFQNKFARNVPIRNEFPLAPPGCLQYFPAPTGTVSNFGFNPNTAIAGNNYPPNLDYSICFRRTATTCGMKFTVVAFSMSGAEHNCLLDYVYIPESIIFKADGSRTTIGLSRVCSQGGAVPANAFIQSVGNFPTYIHVVTDNANNNNENGFSFQYEVPPSTNCI